MLNENMWYWPCTDQTSVMWNLIKWSNRRPQRFVVFQVNLFHSDYTRSVIPHSDIFYNIAPCDQQPVLVWFKIFLYGNWVHADDLSSHGNFCIEKWAVSREKSFCCSSFPVRCVKNMALVHFGVFSGQWKICFTRTRKELFGAKNCLDPINQ